MLGMEVRALKSLLGVLEIKGKTLIGELAQIGRFGKIMVRVIVGQCR